MERKQSEDFIGKENEPNAMTNLDGVEVRLRRQLAHYFSDKNLWKDDWLMERLGGEGTGWIDVSVVAGFKKMEQITTELEVVIASIKCVEGLEVAEIEGEPVRVRRTRSVPAKPPPVDSEMRSVGTEPSADDSALQEASTSPMDAPLPSESKENQSIPGFREVPKTGVIYVMDKAAQNGYNSATAHEWANLGQGSPETTQTKDWPRPVRKKLAELVQKGKLTSESGPWDLKSIELNEENLHYGNVNGDLALRQAVAKLYNDLYRKGKSTYYTAENVAIVGGGRLALTRLCCAMGTINLGHFLPDYTAYAELLSQFKNINSIPILLEAENNFHITPRELKREIVGRGLSALLLSNPCNPTGQLVEGENLKSWVRMAKETQCTFVLDEIYSRYIYTHHSPSDALWRIVSAAQFVEDVNSDPVVILDGLTKAWRMPGARICWVVGPKSVISAIGAAGSFMDGGAALPTQRAVVPLLKPKSVIEQTIMLQALFTYKRDFVLRRLETAGIVVDSPPQATFYMWCDVGQLPAPLNTCWGFFSECLKEKVIVTPGVFFDVNPGARRKACRYESYIRISFGPCFHEILRGVEAIERVIKRYSKLSDPIIDGNVESKKFSELSD